MHIMKKSSLVAKIAKIETDWSFEEAPGHHGGTARIGRQNLWRQQGSIDLDISID